MRLFPTQRPDANLEKLLLAYEPYDDEETQEVRQLRDFLTTSSNPYDRSNLVAHIVADAWILNPERTKTLLVQHKASGFWMAPGGHCDGNPDVYSSALRETAEETELVGLTPLSSRLFDVHLNLIEQRVKPHGIEPMHLHFDVCFVLEGDESFPLVISDESTALEWVELEKIRYIKFWPGHMRRVHKTLAWR